MADNVSLHGESTTNTASGDSGKRFLESIWATLHSLHVISPTQVSGSIARYHVAAQSTSRSRIELPTGAKAIRIGYFARKTDGASTSDGEILKVVFNVSGTTEAGNALAETASSPGATISGVSYLAIPIDTVYETAFPDPEDRLYYVDFLTLTAEAGESDVIVEVTL